MATYRNHVSGSMSDSMLEQPDFDLSHSIDLLTNRSSGTLISATTNKNRFTNININNKTESSLTETTVNAAECATELRPLLKYPSSGNLTSLDCTDEKIKRSVTAFTLNNKGTNNSHKTNSGDKSSGSNYGQSPSPLKKARAKIILICEPDSHPFQTRTILLAPTADCKVGRLISKHRPNDSNAIFDCKVLSRNHALFSFCGDEKFWLKDLNSSNGTFVNDKKLDVDPTELHYGDIVRFGVDVMEHTKNELHGCIKAYLELYLPDGRPASPSSPEKVQRSEYVSEGYISFDDLQQLSVYMQETSQRKQEFEMELQHAQNLLDASRQDTSECWQALLNKDQALQRIHLLEKKIVILETNMPEQALKGEIIKLEEEKVAYKLTAKETLESVQLECNEVLQKLPQMEINLAKSKSNYILLHEQIANAETSLQGASERLRLLEADYNGCLTKSEELKAKAQTDFESCINEMNEKVQEHNEECKSLQHRLAEVMQQNALSDDSDDFHSQNNMKKKLEMPAQKFKKFTVAPVRCNENNKPFEKAERESVDKEIESVMETEKRGATFESPQNSNKIDEKRSSAVGGDNDGEERDLMKSSVYTETDIDEFMLKLRRLELNFKGLKCEIDDIFGNNNKNNNSKNSNKNKNKNLNKEGNTEKENPKLLENYEISLESGVVDEQKEDSLVMATKPTLEFIDDIAEAEGNYFNSTADLQQRINELKSKLRAKDRDVKRTLEELAIKRDSYKDKVAELLKVSENWQENVSKKVTKCFVVSKSTPVIGDTAGDHVSCDSGVSVVDKMTETYIKSFVNASSNTMGVLNDQNDVDVDVVLTDTKGKPQTISNAIKQQLQEEMKMAQSKIAQRNEQIKICKENVEMMDQKNAKLRQDVMELQERGTGGSDNAAFVQTVVPVVVVLFGVLVYFVLSYV